MNEMSIKDIDRGNAGSANILAISSRISTAIISINVKALAKRIVLTSTG